jgi:sulfatase modifying factor 1
VRRVRQSGLAHPSASAGTGGATGAGGAAGVSGSSGAGGASGPVDAALPDSAAAANPDSAGTGGATGAGGAAGVSGSSGTGGASGPVDAALPDSAAAANPDSGDGSAGSAGMSAIPPSCAPGGKGLTDCGPSGESCCTSPPVPRGSFSRGYDGVTCPGGPDAAMQWDDHGGCFENSARTATISDFRLDKYEVTVGRFRQFVAAIVAGWAPPAGSGKHTHLNGGKGLSTPGTSTGYELGWDPSAASPAHWDLTFPCNTPAGRTWTSSIGGNETKPMNCIAWYEAYAFCIWDGGFLPSEAEWNYAAAGGSQQRVYPWSSPPNSTSVDCSRANYHGCVALAGLEGAAKDVGSESPLGDGRWGHSDLAGNLDEVVLDSASFADLAPTADRILLLPAYPTPCLDCVYWNPTPSGQGLPTIHLNRGGNYLNSADRLIVSNRSFEADYVGQNIVAGARCARAP